MSDEAWEKVGWSPEGERPYHRFQETRVLDSWIHLQDIRDALLQPEDDHGAGEEIVVNRFEAALPFVVGKKMKAPDGTAVQVNLTGRLARTIVSGVRDGRASALASRRMHAHAGDHDPGRALLASWRRSDQRRRPSLSASATDVRGDRALAQPSPRPSRIMI